LAILKPIATCLTIGSGGAGGFFAPSLLLGAAVGGAFGTIVKGLGWAPAANPAHYAVVGMAAMVAIVLHAPLTAILIVYEITQSYEIIVPLMFAAVIATIVGRLISPESMYTTQLARLGVRVGAMSDLTILRRLTVEDVTLGKPVVVHPQESAQRLLDLSEEHSVTDFVVTDDRDHYVGMVTASDLRAALVYREAIPLLQVHELQRSDLPIISVQETLDVVIDKFSKHDADSLAVLDDDGSGSVRGVITRSSLMQRYQSALSRD
jgi:CIC family chloride channel protein